MKQKTEPATAVLKRKRTNIFNPAEHELTGSEYEVFQIMRKRESERLLTMTGDVAEDWGDKNRSYTYRVLKSLADKKLIQSYNRRYYRVIYPPKN